MLFFSHGFLQVCKWIHSSHSGDVSASRLENYFQLQKKKKSCNFFVHPPGQEDKKHTQFTFWHFAQLYEDIVCLLHSYSTVTSLTVLNLVVIVLGAGVLVLHAPCGCPYDSLLGCCLDMGVLPGSCGPFLLRFGHAGPGATVEIMDLSTM